MAILNYTTKIESSTTTGQIQSILLKAGAHQVTVHAEAGEPTGISFAIPMGAEKGLVFFQLPCNREGVLKAMSRDTNIPRSKCNPAQAQRVAWRIIKDWCEAQLAIIEAGQAELAEVFLPYAMTKDGTTLFKVIEAGNVPLLGQ